MNNNLNIIWYERDVNKAARSAPKYQTPCIVWFTGLVGSRKSFIAGAVEQNQFSLGQNAYLLIGDNACHGLYQGLGFSNSGKVENIRRIGEMSKLFIGVVVLVLSIFISPFKAGRKVEFDLVGNKKFVKVFVDTPLATCVDGHSKGSYRKARAGEIKNFAGIDSEYEMPGKLGVTNDTVIMSFKKRVITIITYLQVSECLPAKQLTKAKG